LFKRPSNNEQGVCRKGEKMDRPAEFRQLTALFRKLGAKDPESWARSEVEEGINQLGRFLFLRQAWASVISEDDESWIDAEIRHAHANPSAPGAGLGLALERALTANVARSDLSEIARVAQWQLLHRICYLLDDPSFEEQELADAGWGLFEVDDDGQPSRRIEGLHESVLETDPTGQEMRAKAR
jgi:hypothetical protein